MAIISHTTLRGARIYSPPADDYNISYLVVAGGGGGGGFGGGGAGGFRPASGFTLALDTAYTVTVGGAGAAALAGSSRGTNGSDWE